jgi:hypothetical protein
MNGMKQERPPEVQLNPGALLLERRSILCVEDTAPSA